MTLAELSASVLQRLTTTPQCSMVDAVRKAQAIIVNRLLLKRSNLIKDVMAVSLSQGDDYFSLSPSGGRGFLSVAGEPFITVDGARTYLKPFDSALTVSATAAKPKYYEKIGRKVYLHPVSDAAYELTLPAYLSPAVPVADGDELPFDGLLDDVIAEAVYGVLVNGVGAVADRAFTAAIETQVDMVLGSIDLADEQTLADSLNYRG